MLASNTNTIDMLFFYIHSDMFTFIMIINDHFRGFGVGGRPEGTGCWCWQLSC